MKGRMEQVSTQNMKQIQRLILSPQMQQALHLLQLPVQELSSVIEEELTQNPLLEYSENDDDSQPDIDDLLQSLDHQIRNSPNQTRREEDDLRAVIENTVALEASLFDHLMKQACETFPDKKRRELAEILIGHLDKDGYLTTPLEEVAALFSCSTQELSPILEVIQTFDPPGVGARDLKEALLIQLKINGKDQTLAFRIIEEHFDDVLQNKLPLIAKRLSCSVGEIKNVIASEMRHLTLRPGGAQTQGHYREISNHITPDLAIHQSEGALSIHINDAPILPLRLNSDYLNMLQEKGLPDETRAYIQEKISSGKWLMRNLHERHQTLHRIAQELIKLQENFFSSPKGQLVPLTMKEIAEKLELHESTVARAVSNKYLACSRGILSLRSFFSHAYTTETGENISSESVKELLLEILDKEDKKSPLSDEKISSLIKKQGIPCARRTVAKYRQELNIGNTSHRRLHHS